MTARAFAAKRREDAGGPLLDDGGDLRLDRLRRGRQQSIDPLAGRPIRTERDAQLGSGGRVAGEPALERAVRDHRPVLAPTRRRAAAAGATSGGSARRASTSCCGSCGGPVSRAIEASSPYIPKAQRSTRRIRSGPARARTSRIHVLPDSSDARAGPLAKAASSATSSNAAPDTIRTGGNAGGSAVGRRPSGAAARGRHRRQYRTFGGWRRGLACVEPGARRGGERGGRPVDDRPAAARSAIRARRRVPGTSCRPGGRPGSRPTGSPGSRCRSSR